MSRLVILDCETTGLDHKSHRIIEIGCVELWDLMPTGNEFHVYINPNKTMDDEVIQVHGITNEFLNDKKTFDYYIESILEFIGNDTIVAHNASFDINFLNEELFRFKKPKLKNEVIDTLAISRKLYGNGNSLDNLCRRYGVNNSIRKTHGALLDAQLLAKVYFFLLKDYNEKQMEEDLWFSDNIQEEVLDKNYIFPTRNHLFQITEEDKNLHNKFMTKFILK